MNFPDAITTGLKKYATISGRASRSEYWFWVLFCILSVLVLSVIDSALFGIDAATGKSNGMFVTIFQIGVLVPNICINARRLHDVDKSGWWQLITFIPIIGLILFIIWAATKGTSGQNRFGPDPLQGN